MNSSKTLGFSSIFRPIHKFMRCSINALKPQMFTLSCSKFNLVAFVGAALLLASCHSDATAARLGDTELEVSKGRIEGGVLPVKTGVAFIKPGEAPLKPQKQVFVDAKATKITFLNVSISDVDFIEFSRGRVVSQMFLACPRILGIELNQNLM